MKIGFTLKPKDGNILDFEKQLDNLEKIGSEAAEIPLYELDVICGKKIIQDELTIHISQSYYGERFVEREEAESLLKNSSIINMAGKQTVSMSVELGIGSENGIKTISNIPFLIVFNT